ncbi:PREDICTED: proline-rich protein 2-like [Camelina sativa]|uniref:Proline-rich protein 2-like n=1 Tax=Camelina sativa TaxID=90675 RepID=A0ABM0SVT2_CAMSA|nr:PREDICTED: proline-rich protein 2-like [Camelina sativa]
MRILPKNGGAYSILLVFALCSVAHSLNRDIKVVGDVEVVGYAESSKFKIPNAFSGLRVTIECKAADSKGPFVTKGSGGIDETGKFNLNIPNHDIVGDDGALKEACYAHLYSASGNPCPAHDGLEASKVVFLSKSGETHVLGLKQSLKFSPEVCISKFFWHMPKFPLPALTFPKIKKPCPPFYKPPVVIPKKPCPPKIAHKPIYKPPVPIYKPPVPVYKPPVVIPKKPCPSKIAHKPIYKPPVPIYKPPVVIPKKPCPPLHKPIDKPSVPIYKPIYKPPVPIYKPIYKPPVVVIPKKPCPPLPKFPSFPPKYIPHPKFGKWPPFPSHP